MLSDPAIYEFENKPPPSEKWLAHRYERLETRGSADGQEKWLNWVVRLPGGALAGYVQATVLPSAASTIAYELHSRYWRQGIGRTAVAAMLEELRFAYAVRSFVAVIKSANFRSLGLLQSLGFSVASPEQIADSGCAPDELVMVKAAVEAENGG